MFVLKKSFVWYLLSFSDDNFDIFDNLDNFDISPEGSCADQGPVSGRVVPELLSMSFLYKLQN